MIRHVLRKMTTVEKITRIGQFCWRYCVPISMIWLGVWLLSSLVVCTATDLSYGTICLWEFGALMIISTLAGGTILSVYNIASNYGFLEYRDCALWFMAFWFVLYGPTIVGFTYLLNYGNDPADVWTNYTAIAVAILAGGFETLATAMVVLFVCIIAARCKKI